MTDEWYVNTDDAGAPFGWTDDGDVFPVYFDKKAGGYLPLTRRRWWRNKITLVVQGIALWGGFLLWASVVGSLNLNGHPSWAMLLLAAPIFYVIGRYHERNK